MLGLRSLSYGHGIVVQDAVGILRSAPCYAALLESYGEEPGGELDNLASVLWHTHVDEGVPPRLRKPLAEIVELISVIAFSVRRAMPELEEFFFSLPRINKDLLEYLGKFFCCPSALPLHSSNKVFDLTLSRSVLCQD